MLHKNIIVYKKNKQLKNTVLFLLRLFAKASSREREREPAAKKILPVFNDVLDWEFTNLSVVVPISLEKNNNNNNKNNTKITKKTGCDVNIALITVSESRCFSAIANSSGSDKQIILSSCSESSSFKVIMRMTVHSFQTLLLLFVQVFN